MTEIGFQNLSYLYSFEAGKDQPEVKAYHFSQDSTAIYGRLNLKTLFEPKKSLKAPVYIFVNCLIYNSFQSKMPIDTVFLRLAPNARELDKGFLDFAYTIYTRKYNRYVASVELRNNQNVLVEKAIVEIDRNDFFGDQFYFLQNQSGIKTSQFYNLNEPIRLQGAFASQIDSFSVIRLSSDIKVPLPPFYKGKMELSDLHEDSVFYTKASEAFSLPSNGMYLIKNNLDKLHGILIYAFYNDYPLISTAIHMIKPLRYITSEAEYEEISNNSDAQEAVELFWIKVAGNKDRARQLIKEYYNRVQYANRFFTDTQQGWCTDRGMIYTVYGKPALIFKDFDHEVWIYNTSTNENVEFWFSKLQHPYTSNFYRLNRSFSFEKSWYDCVGKWREGIVVNPSF